MIPDDIRDENDYRYTFVGYNDELGISFIKSKDGQIREVYQLLKQNLERK